MTRTGSAPLRAMGPTDFLAASDPVIGSSSFLSPSGSIIYRTQPRSSRLALYTDPISNARAARNWSVFSSPVTRGRAAVDRDGLGLFFLAQPPQEGSIAPKHRSKLWSREL
jgi:hypothetical protein